MARTALDLTRQDWSLTGQTVANIISSSSSSSSSQGEPPQIITTSGHKMDITGGPSVPFYNKYHHPTLAELGEKVGREEIVERMVSLLFIRVVALVTGRLGNTVPSSSKLDGKHTDSSEIKGGGGGGGGGGGSSKKKKKQKIYADYSTTTICRAALQLNNKDTVSNKQQQQQQQQLDDNLNTNGETTATSIHDETDKGYHSEPATQSEIKRKNKYNKINRRASDDPSSPPSRKDIYSSSSSSSYGPESKKSHLLFPALITPRVISQLRNYVKIICGQYHTPGAVPYHNVEHAYHVFLSANKLLDLMLCENPEEFLPAVPMPMMNGSSGGGGSGNTADVGSTMAVIKRRNRRRSMDSQTSSVATRHRPTFGLKSDPLAHLAFLFSALVHDVDHTGISNRQLVLESDDLAILYNDQSVAEQRSLAVAFTTLKQNGKNGADEEGGYGDLREVLFPMQQPGATTGDEDFFKFRKLVIDLVLVTDIASPERTQIVKSKWKEAFGDVIVAEKLKKSASQKMMKGIVQAKKQIGRGRDYYRVERNKIKTLDPTDEDRSLEEKDFEPSKLIKEFEPSKLIPSRRSGEERSNSGGSNKSSEEFTRLKNNRAAEQPIRKSLVSNTDSNGGDSIYFDSSESSLSDVNSFSDDFDESAVSRSKMNFDGLLENSSLSNMSNTGSGNSDGADVGGDNDDNDEEGNGMVVVTGVPAEGTDKSTNNSIGREGRGRAQGRSAYRWSTGDVTFSHDDDGDEGEDKGGLIDKETEQQLEASPVRGRAPSARAPRSMAKSLITPTNTGSPTNHRRRKTTLARLSQSMVVGDIRRSRPRAHSEERRLGVRRALDLAGSTITAYSSFRGSTGSSNEHVDDMMTDEEEFDPDDDVDEFKATVVLEQMIRAADVAALIQDWDNSVKWSTRLYKELMNGFVLNRGENPSVGWYENQIKFLDFYILPLAKNLGVMGVFEESVGGMFAKCVKSNLARWIEEGARATDLMIKEEQEERGGNSLAKQVETLGINAPSAEDNIPSLMSSSNSCSASSKACIVCGESTGRFRCPVCAAIYCCAKCCREHKASSDCRPR